LARIPGTRADTAVAVQKEAREVYYASHNWNPLFIEGLKTVAFELSEQLGWKVPDAVICPVGYGGIYLGLYRGFRELMHHGIVNRLPKLFGVQSESVPPIYDAFRRGAVDVDEALSKKSIAEGIACIKPIRGKEILEIARLTNGGFEVVSEAQIVEGWHELCRQGIYVEPTSAVVVKAIDRLLERKLVSPDDHIIVILTGIGLKATETLGQYLPEG
jgi:threonine synthase